MKRFTTVWQTLLTLCLLVLTLQGQAAPVVQFIHTDALGSPIAATGDQGQLLWREEYQPFGERIIQDTASVSRKSWYTGHIEDQDTGLIYMGARFYDPQIGRFLSIDPVGFSNDNPMQFNRYAYANNNPYKYVDPDGRSPALGLLVGGALILGFSDYANTPALGQQGISKSLLEKVLTVVGAAAIGGTRIGLTGVASAGDDVVTNSAFSISNKQLGKKLGKHVEDFGGNPANPIDRKRVTDLINDIGTNPDKTVRGTFSGQGTNGGRGAVDFRIKANDVVVTKPDGSFVTILKDGVNNTSVKEALGGG